LAAVRQGWRKGPSQRSRAWKRRIIRLFKAMAPMIEFLSQIFLDRGAG
jgi:hypothetical protein